MTNVIPFRRVSGVYVSRQAEYASKPYTVTVRDGSQVVNHRFGDEKAAKAFRRTAKSVLKEVRSR